MKKTDHFLQIFHSHFNRKISTHHRQPTIAPSFDTFASSPVYPEGEDVVALGGEPLGVPTPHDGTDGEDGVLLHRFALTYINFIEGVHGFKTSLEQLKPH